MITRLLVLACALLAAQASIGAPLDDALAAYEAKDYARAHGLLKPLADAGNAPAQMHIGLLYYLGQGVPENERVAVDWLTKSAGQGNLDAMYHLGNVYVFGNDAAKFTAEPDVEAAKWYFEAGRAGHRDAQYALGLLFLAGKGVVQSRELAVEWIRKAAERGHPEAQGFIQGLGRQNH